MTMINTRETVSEYVYRKIKKSIISNKYEPNQKLKELNISKELNVSPTPVREGFRRLVSEGYLKEIPYKGVMIREYSENEKIEVMYYAGEIMSLFMQRAFEKNTKEDYRDTLKILENNIIKEQSSNEFFIGNIYFYSSIVKLVDSNILEACIQPVLAVIRLEKYKNKLEKCDFSYIIILYRELLKNLINEDTDMIRKTNLKIVDYLTKL